MLYMAQVAPTQTHTTSPHTSPPPQPRPRQVRPDARRQGDAAVSVWSDGQRGPGRGDRAVARGELREGRGGFERKRKEGEEEHVVTFSDAGPDPGAVVVVDFDACAAVATVEGARLSVNVACTTLVTHDWFSFHHGDVVNLWLFFINCDKDTIEFFLLTCLTSPGYDPRVTERGKKQERQTQAHCHTVHTVQHSLPGVLAIHYSYL